MTPGRFAAYALGTVGIPAFSFGGFAMHLYATYLAFQTGSFFATALTFATPPVSDFVWFASSWRHEGLLNTFTWIVFAWLAGGAASAVAYALIARDDAKHTGKNPRSVAKEMERNRFSPVACATPFIDAHQATTLKQELAVLPARKLVAPRSEAHSTDELDPNMLAIRPLED